ncbi:MAG: 5-methylcytosine restriction system specificity protein McrC, partial [Halanaerobiales bacterium]
MIELTAYGEEKLLPAGKINREDRIFLHEQKDVEDNQGQRFGLRETEEGLYIKPLNYVGVIQLSELKINIRPRFDGGFSRLIPLLSFCREMDYSFTLRNTGITTGELALEEVVVRLLLEEVEEILNRGAFKEYRTYERNLNVMRGRVDLRKQLTRNQLRGDRLYCRYDELDTDIIENRILLRALNIARRLHAGRDVTRRADRYYHRLARFCEEYRGKGMLELEYNRLNYFYRQAHFYCRLLLENTGTADIYRGQDSGYYTLLLDMNELLEEFVS